MGKVLKIVDVKDKSPEQILQLQIANIIEAVKSNPFIYNIKHPLYTKRGKRIFFWFRTTQELNESFPMDKLNRKIYRYL